MTLKNTLENYLGGMLHKYPQVKEQLDKMSPNDSTIKKIMDNGIGEKEMAKFEKQESEYLSGNDLVGIEDVRLKILTEVKEESSNFGMKPKCSVEVTKQGVTTTQKWTLNQQNTNYLIDSFGGESTAWIGKTVGVFIENIKGNNAIRIKA